MSMKSLETQSPPMLRISQALKAFWRLPSLTVARFTLVSYIRSGWILGDIAIVWLLYAAFFLEIWWQCRLLLRYNWSGTWRSGNSWYHCDRTACYERSRLSSAVQADFPFCLRTRAGDSHGSIAYSPVRDDDAPWDGFPYSCAIVGHTRRDCNQHAGRFGGTAGEQHCYLNAGSSLLRTHCSRVWPVLLCWHGSPLCSTQIPAPVL